MIRLHGIPEVALARGGLRARREKLADFQTLHRKTGEHLLDWSRRNFESGGALHEDFPAGWPPLADSTLATRRRKGWGTRPLEVSGALRRGFTLTVERERAVVDNPVPYAATHQEGLGVPRRPFFPTPGQARGLVLPEAQAHVEEMLR